MTPKSNASAAVRAYVRKETFLAHYPRSLKLAVTGVFLAGLLGVWVLPHASHDETVFGGGEPSPQQRVVTGQEPLSPEGQLSVSRASTNRSADPEAVAINDTDDRNARMGTAPDPGLSEAAAGGILPKTGEDGRKPWQIYARPFNPGDTRPRVAIVMVDMGLSGVASDAVVRRLPGPVTLAFDAQSPVLGPWLNRARQDGHETLLSLPMEPFDYPRSDPGPDSLLTNLPNSNLTQRLLSFLGRGTGYVGVTTMSGSRFTTDPAKIQLVLDTLKERGLMAFDARVSPHSVLRDMAKQDRVPVASTTLSIDRDPSPAAIDAALHQLEQTAQLDGRAVGIATPLPVTLDRLELWIKQLPHHGVALAPITAVVE